MAVSGRWYPKAQVNFQAGDIDYDTGTIKMALVTSSHSFNDTHEFWNDVSTNEASGTGYSAGGATLGTKTNSVVDSSALTAWQATTSYAVGDLVRKSTDDGHCYRCVVAGTSDGSEPTWVTTTLRETAETGSVRWVEFGAAYQKISSAQVQWTISGTITARYAILYETGSAGVDDYLLGQIDFGQDETASGGGTFTITPHATGWLRVGLGSDT